MSSCQNRPTYARIVCLTILGTGVDLAFAEQSDLFRPRSGQESDEVAKGLSSRAILNLPAKKERLVAGYTQSEEGVF